MKFPRINLSLAGVGLFLMGSVSWAQSISMSYVTVGNPGNVPDSSTGSLYGEVNYSYNIGEYDVTDSQYCTFLNEVDPTGANVLGLYSGGLNSGDTSRNAEYGLTYNSGAANGSKYSVINGYANMPVGNVDYWDTLRFVNWMNNGEGNASTETGAYTLTGGNTDGNGTPSNAADLLANPQHNAGATVWLPSEDEWYKAAYYDPANGTYTTYATQSDIIPGSTIGGGSNEANWYGDDGFSVTQSPTYVSSTNYLTAVGSYTNSASYYGTYDQTGDVNNWLDTTVDSDSALVRGGWWGDSYPPDMSASYSLADDPTTSYYGIGFRVAAVPEPSTWAMMAAGVASLLVFRRRNDASPSILRA